MMALALQAQQLCPISQDQKSMIKTLFMGRKKVAANCLEWLYATSGFDVIGVVTDSHLAESCTSQVASRLGIPLLDYDSASKLAESLDIDLGISVLYWRKLKGEMLLPRSKYGCINFHPAVLPEYKGCAGYNIAILEGLLTWGSSCHYVDERIDTGGIIDVVNFTIDDVSETAKSLEAKTLSAMELQFKEVMNRLLLSSGSLEVSPNVGGRYFSRKDMENMKRIVPGDDPERKARAFFFPPYDGAWVEVNGQKVNVISTSVLRSLAEPLTSSLFTEASETP